MVNTVKGTAYLENTADIKKVVVVNETNEAGYCTFDIIDFEFANFATIDALYWVEITVEEWQNNQTFKGEIKKITYETNTWTAKIHATGIMAKIQNKVVSYDPRLESGSLYAHNDQTDLRIIPLWDEHSTLAFTAHIGRMTINEHQNKFLSIFDSDLRNIKFRSDYNSDNVTIRKHSTQAEYSGSVTEINNYDRMVYDDGRYFYGAGNEYTVYQNTQSTVGETDTRFDLDIALRTSTDADSSEVDYLVINFSGRVGYKNKWDVALIGHHPKMYIYDYTGSTWEEVFDYFDDDDSNLTPGGFDSQDWGLLAWGTAKDSYHSPTFNQNLELRLADLVRSSWDDYMTTVQASGSNTERTVSIRIYSGGNTGDGAVHAVTIYNLDIDIYFITDRLTEYGTRKISSNDSVQLVLTDTGIADSDGMFLTDNWSTNDKITITANLSVIVAAIWAIFKPTGWDLDFASNVDSTYSEIINNMSLWEVLKLFSDMSNYEFWYEEVAGTNTIIAKETTNMTSSGITLTDSKMSNVTFENDANNLRSEITTFGSYGVEINQSLTPEVGVTYDEVYLTNTDLITSGQATDYTTEKSLQYETISRNIVVTLWFNKAGTDYSAIKVGRKIAVTYAPFGMSSSSYYIKRIMYYSINNNDYLLLNLREILTP